MTQQGEKATIARGAGLPLRVALYFALAASAVLTMAGLPAIEQRVESGLIHPFWLLAPALCFGLFLTIYLADRVWLLRFRKYPSGRALFQIVFGLVFLMMLLPSSIKEYRSHLKARPTMDSLSKLIGHKQAVVRAMACELAGFRGKSSTYLPALGRALGDKDADVRGAAQLAIKRLTGETFSPDRQGQRAFELFLQERQTAPAGSQDHALRTAGDDG